MICFSFFAIVATVNCDKGGSKSCATLACFFPLLSAFITLYFSSKVKTLWQGSYLWAFLAGSFFDDPDFEELGPGTGFSSAFSRLDTVSSQSSSETFLDKPYMLTQHIYSMTHLTAERKNSNLITFVIGYSLHDLVRHLGRRNWPHTLQQIIGCKSIWIEKEKEQ